MIAEKVLSKDELEAILETRGFQKTEETTATGTYWQDSVTKRHLLVPFPYEGYYPDWILRDMLLHIGQIPTYSSIVMQHPANPPKKEKKSGTKKKPPIKKTTNGKNPKP
jgi:hypothetical protein